MKVPRGVLPGPSAHRSQVRDDSGLDFTQPGSWGAVELFWIVLEAQAFLQLCGQRWWRGRCLLAAACSLRLVGQRGKNSPDVHFHCGALKCALLKLGPCGFLPTAFFELISKAQSNRADDQRGLLRKEDLVLPEFLRLPLGTPVPGLPCGTPATSPSQETAPRPGEPRGPAQDHPNSPATSPSSADSPPFCTPTTPATPTTPVTPTPYAQEVEAGDIQTVEGEHMADLTLTGEGDISSPNSTLLPPPPARQDSAGPPRAGTSGQAPAHL